MNQLDPRMPGIALAIWVGMWAATSERWLPALIAAAAAVVLGLCGMLGRQLLVVVLAAVVLATVGIGGVRTAALVTHPVRALAAEQGTATIEFTARTDPRYYAASATRPGLTVVNAQLHHLTTRGGQAGPGNVRGLIRVRAVAEDADRLLELPVGTRLRASVSLRPPDPGDPYLAEVTVRRLEVLAPPGPWNRGVEHVRAGLREAVATLPPEQRALVPSLVVGDLRHMTDELRADFEVTGLTHLTAVSGANLAILAAFCMIAARWAGVRGRWLLLVGAVAVVVFIALCRTEPSVLRAAAMGTVALLAVGTHATTARGLRHLAVAAAALLVLDPWLSRSLGFTLSVLASAGIIIFARRWTAAMSWAPRWLAELWTVPLAAQLATQPVVTLISDRVSLVGLMTNAVTGPAVGPATVLGFATAGLGTVAPVLAGFTGWLAGWCAQWILWVAHAGAALPGAEMQWRATPFALLVVGAASAAMLALGEVVLRRRWVVLGLLVLLVVMICHRPPAPGWPPRQWDLVSCSVGQGDATVLRAGPGSAVVVDTGPDPQALGSCLASLGIRHIPLLVLTHYHSDHVDGRAEAWSRMGPGDRVWVAPVASPQGTAAAVAHEAAARGVVLERPAVGSALTVGETHLQVLGPARLPRSLTSTARAGAAESADENDTSLVLRTHTGALRVLLPGDLEPDGQRAVQRHWGEFTVDVVKVPHHGSKNQYPAFVTGHGAVLALVSCGEDNDHGHPADATVDLVQSAGMRMHRTDLEGSIAVAHRDGQLEVVTQRAL